ncbi:NRAMP family divalent metal transporter [Ornithinimicrobium avium]|uniref:Divalent metal cation transporter n=1 Tax=Ornithinimicrobium avium TaxID=2283195 RepID=A0A345NM49_9MICO|nr:divalent metal cation transporter [Ornithinimicrobium avium]AXH96107.1 divalent metal cation transporter [Ornithinimicrobium avium]
MALPSSPLVQAEPVSTWRTRIGALGPGLLAASAAIGASHLVSSTQAGALFGWQLALVIVLANVLKYPFFRFGPQFAGETGLSLVEGYAQKGKPYLWVFLLLSIFAGIVSTAGVVLLCVVILSFLLPASWATGVPVLAVIIMAATLVLLLAGHYKALDGLTKLIVVSLAVSTVVAVGMAAAHPSVRQAGFVDPSPWNLATLPFLVALVGWMPAPIEVSAMNSMWVKAKQQDRRLATRDILFDFNVGFLTSAVLALFFLGLGVLVQYGSGEELQRSGGAYIPQLMEMYADAIGRWAVPLMAFIGFAAMFGTVITVVDGYARLVGESIRLLRGRPELERRAKDTWIVVIGLVGLAIVLWMGAELATMLNFAMISAFITAPVFAWLNFSLIRRTRTISPVLRSLAWTGLFFLTGFAVLFVLTLAGLVG